jgi:ElaB/YqjD/DUF883 family membrane-anchored ribosome-binding protein
MQSTTFKSLIQIERQILKRKHSATFVSALRSIVHRSRLPKTASARKLGEINWRLSMAEENEAQQTGSGMTDAEGKLQSSRTHARQAAEDLKSAAGVIAGEYRGKAEQVWDDARDRVRTFQQDADQYVRENPTKAVITALGIGFVLGLIFRR